jgi:hypothetical protein
VITIAREGLEDKYSLQLNSGEGGVLAIAKEGSWEPFGGHPEVR